ncbi:hypothetical protein [Synechococcus elongatus]|uniref:hypothetical protein n=1 Tax=Synechococcus elongatus TaxID=32046 RepID=UPI0030D456D0
MPLRPLAFRSGSTQGLTVGELLLIIIVAGAIVGGSWWLWQRFNPEAEASKAVTTLPQIRQ